MHSNLASRVLLGAAVFPLTLTGAQQSQSGSGGGSSNNGNNGDNGNSGNSGSSGGGGGGGDNCIRLTGDSSYSWHADGDFSGSGNIDNSPHCFGPGSGGISIGAPGASSGASGNTRIECHFPSGESNADFYNCNLSLVDGFSAAVTCTVAGGGWPNSNDPTAPLGCGYDLMSQCPEDAKDPSCKCCKNKKGASVSGKSNVDSVFQHCDDSKDNPNSAEIFYNMKGAYKFQKSDFPITCKVGQGQSVGNQKRAVDAHHHQQQHHRSQSVIGDEAGAGAARAHQHRSSSSGAEKVREVKIRSLADMMR